MEAFRRNCAGLHQYDNQLKIALPAISKRIAAVKELQRSCRKSGTSSVSTDIDAVVLDGLISRAARPETLHNWQQPHGLYLAAILRHRRPEAAIFASCRAFAFIARLR